jgi:hypothetical protein
MSKRKQLLDPIGTMCKLIGLNFSETNTKISIHEHILTLQRPNNYQFLIRIYNGDGRENISELYYAVVRLVQWYLMPETQETIVTKKINSQRSRHSRTSQTSHNSTETENGSDDDEATVKYVEINVEANAIAISRSEELRKMVQFLCHSLRKLQETYAYGNVVFALQFYINILEAGLSGTYDDSMLPTYLTTGESSNTNFLDYQKIRNIWDVDRLRKVCELYDRCFSSEISDESGPIIDGYLRSIDAVLVSTDHEFQQLIKNSNEG